MLNLRERVQDTRASTVFTPLLVPTVLGLVLWCEFLARSRQWRSSICLYCAPDHTSYSKPSLALALFPILMSQLPADSSMHVSGIICKLAHDKSTDWPPLMTQNQRMLLQSHLHTAARAVLLKCKLIDSQAFASAFLKNHVSPSQALHKCPISFPP